MSVETAQTSPATERLNRPEALTLARVIAILQETAIDTFITTILVLVFGSIALQLAGEVWKEMAPSLPPGFAPKPQVELEAPAHSMLAACWSSLRQHQFGVVYTIFFAVTAWSRLVGHANDEQPCNGSRARRRSWRRKVMRRFSKQWFDLIVGNAFGAFVSAMVLFWVQQFSLTQLFWHGLLDFVQPAIQGVANLILGRSLSHTLNAWFSWYGQNQLKFLFWGLYIAAICDDLGLPNIKTLGRLAWQKILNRKETELTATASQAVSADDREREHMCEQTSQEVNADDRVQAQSPKRDQCVME